MAVVIFFWALVVLTAIVVLRGIEVTFFILTFLSSVGLHVILSCLDTERYGEVSPLLMASLSVFFFFPFIFFSRILRAKRSVGVDKGVIQLGRGVSRRQASLFVLVYSIVFWSGIVVLYDNNLLYLRVGYERLAQSFLGLGPFERILVKILQDVSPPLIVLSIISARLLKSLLWKGVVYITAVANIAFIALNSRYDLLCFLIVAVFVIYGGKMTIKRTLKIIIPAVLLLVLTLIRPVAEMVLWGRHDAVEKFAASTQWIDRFNGFSSINAIFHNFSIRGWMLGGAWQELTLPMYRFLDPEFYFAKKSAGVLGSKLLLWEHFTGEKVSDYVGSNLSDWLANFGFPSLIVYSLLLAYIIRFCSRIEVGSRNIIFVRIFVLYSILHVNANFANFLSVMTRDFVLYLAMALPLILKFSMTTGAESKLQLRQGVVDQNCGKLSLSSRIIGGAR